MKNTFGNSLTVTVFGESHGPGIGCIIDGISPGVKIDTDYIKHCLSQRQAIGAISTPRHEADEPEFISGIKNGCTEGTPICILIRNTNTKSEAYSKYENTPRPSHADFSAECKYHGFQDKCGGGHFSGRITAAIVAAGALIRYALLNKGIKIATHIKMLHGIYDRDFSDFRADCETLFEKSFPVLDGDAEEKMKDAILHAREDGDSVGGILETAVEGFPSGVGEPWFDTIEGLLAQAMFSIPGIKGIEFGAGFDFASMKGSEANDPFAYENGKVITKKNSNGGINGGISNGMPIVFRLAVKPTPSISKEQSTVDLSMLEDTTISIRGRHDPAIIHRARAVVDAMCAITLADMLITRYGTDYLRF